MDPNNPQAGGNGSNGSSGSDGSTGGNGWPGENRPRLGNTATGARTLDPGARPGHHSRPIFSDRSQRRLTVPRRQTVAQEAVAAEAEGRPRRLRLIRAGVSYGVSASAVVRYCEHVLVVAAVSANSSCDQDAAIGLLHMTNRGTAAEATVRRFSGLSTRCCLPSTRSPGPGKFEDGDTMNFIDVARHVASGRSDPVDPRVQSTPLRCR